MNDKCVMEKYLIRRAFSEDFCLNAKKMALLPESILWRRKEAFSDGVTNQTKSLYEIIDTYASAKFIKDDMPFYSNASSVSTQVVINKDSVENMCRIHPAMLKINNHLIPSTAEQFYYRKLFETYYSGQGKLVPYFWMPKYVDAKDASARTLDIYAQDPTFLSLDVSFIDEE
jgi:asparagine synthase (glutamine-hydrolysing)